MPSGKQQHMAAANLAQWIRSKPQLSTYIAALYLAAIWLLTWLIIFFLTTWLLKISTGKEVFIMALWLAVVAETIIRYVENLDYVAFFSKPAEPDPRGDNKDFTLSRMFLLLFIGLFTAFLFVFLGSEEIAIITSRDSLFNGQPYPGKVGFVAMLDSWVATLRNDKEIQLALMLSLLFRVAIYKRSAKPQTTYVD